LTCANKYERYAATAARVSAGRTNADVLAAEAGCWGRSLEGGQLLLVVRSRRHDIRRG
jgi:hypothetical protein